MVETQPPLARALEWRDKDWRDDEGELVPEVVDVVCAMLVEGDARA